MRDSWTETALGKILSIQSGFSFSTNDWTADGYPVIKINNVRDGKVSTDSCSYISDPIPQGAEKFLLKRGDLLITLTGEIGATGIVDQTIPMYLNQRVGKVTIRDESKALLPFVAALLNLPEVRREMWSLGKGNAQLNISPSSIQEIVVKLPPLAGQTRIVDVVSSVDAYIDALQKQADTARSARNAVLHELLSAGGDDWTETTIGQITELVPGKYIPKSDYVENGQFFIYGSNSVMGKYSHSLIDGPHTVMAAIGAYAGAVRYSPVPSWVNNNAFGLITNSEIQPKYLFLWLATNLDLATVVAGTGQPYVQRSMLQSTSITMPELAEQKRIVEIVSSMDEVIQSTEQAVADAKNLRLGLLSDLLSGEHEIPASYDVFVGAA